MDKKTNREVIAKRAEVSQEVYDLAEILAPHLWASDYAPGIGDKGDYVTDPRTLAQIVLAAGYTLPAPPADDVREAVQRGYNAAPGLAVDLVVNSIMQHLAAFEVRPHGTVTDAEVLRLGKVAWVAYQDDKSWAESVVEDCFSPADDLPEEALDMIAVARAVLKAAREVHP